MADTTLPATVLPEDAAHRAVRQAYGLSVPATVVGVAVLVGVGLFSATSGAAGLPVGGVLVALVDWVPLLGLESSLSATQHDILFQIRLPRLALGLLVGGSLGLAGATYQGVFRNPLADPYLLGVSAGAGFGAVLALGFGLDLGWGPFDTVPAAAFVGALVAVMASMAIARGGAASPATLLLGGVAMAALFSAAQTYAIQQLDETRAGKCSRGCSASSTPAAGRRFGSCFPTPRCAAWCSSCTGATSTSCGWVTTRLGPWVSTRCVPGWW